MFGTLVAQRRGLMRPFFAFLVLTVAGGAPWLLLAEVSGATAVATSFEIAGGAQNGDLVSYDPATNTYSKTRGAGDENLFGVVVIDPVLQVTSVVEVGGRLPIVRFGEALVAVSDLAGPVEAGDIITSSRISGVGQRAPKDTVVHMLGVALAPLDVTDTTTEEVLVDEQPVHVGLVPIALRIGLYVPSDQQVATSSGALGAETGASAAASGGKTSFDGTTVLDLFRYVLAAAVTLASIVIALRSFGGSLSQSIVSVGRNPLARPYIVSMMLWNSFLIILISGVGLAIGAAIIVLPS